METNKELMPMPMPIQELISKYWEIAYSLERTNISRGDEAHQILSSIHEAWQAAQPTPAQGDAGQDGPTEAEYAAVFADDVLDEVMKERDHYHDVADGLADAIAKYFGAEIGEHSSSNCPWDEAMRVIEESNDYQQFPNATRQSSADAVDAARIMSCAKTVKCTTWPIEMKIWDGRSARSTWINSTSTSTLPSQCRAGNKL